MHPAFIPETARLIEFLVASIIVIVVPGPDFVYITARSMAQGWKAGVLSSLGVMTGNLVHLSAALLGLSAILVASAWAFEAVKLAGAAYLIYLGLKMIFAKNELGSKQLSKDNDWKIFRQAMMTNALNPKVAVFYLAFIPQFVDPKHFAGQFIFLSALFVLTAVPWLIFLSFGAGKVGGWLKERPRAAKAQERVSGLLLWGLALKLAFEKR